jgi:hypothetical protein
MRFHCLLYSLFRWKGRKKNNNLRDTCVAEQFDRCGECIVCTSGKYNEFFSTLFLLTDVCALSPSTPPFGQNDAGLV